MLRRAASQPINEPLQGDSSPTAGRIKIWIMTGLPFAGLTVPASDRGAVSEILDCATDCSTTADDRQYAQSVAVSRDHDKKAAFALLSPLRSPIRQRRPSVPSPRRLLIGEIAAFSGSILES